MSGQTLKEGISFCVSLVGPFRSAEGFTPWTIDLACIFLIRVRREASKTSPGQGVGETGSSSGIQVGVLTNLLCFSCAVSDVYAAPFDNLGIDASQSHLPSLGRVNYWLGAARPVPVSAQ